MKRVLTDFIGRWAIERAITPVDAPPAEFHGFAIFDPSEGGANYAEAGTLMIQGQTPMHSERRYRWDTDLNVYFEDGRFFHSVPSMGGDTRHWCDPDDYAVVYDFGAWPDWNVTWHVRGPRKNYQMRTRYRKAA